jgi:putative addiction module component (TIGR02574 family)
MLAEAEIKSMSLTERLQAMELLWRSFSDSEDEVPSPDWHREVLSERLAKVEAGEGKFLTISELKARLASKRA